MSFSIGAPGPRMGPGMALERFGERAEGRAFDPVSYTHLTLPTSDLV